MHDPFKRIHLTYNMRERALRIMYFNFSGKYDYHKWYTPYDKVYITCDSRTNYHFIKTIGLHIILGVIKIPVASSSLRQILTF